MKIKKISIHFIVIITFIYSKFFYIPIIGVGDLNFTLSDLCILIMLYFVLTSRTRLQLFYKKILILSLLMLIIFSIGSIIQNTSILNGIVMFIKRWVSLLILPIYISMKFKRRDIKAIVYSLLVIVVCFTLINFDSLLKSLDTTRFSDAFNPNILGMVMSIVLIFILSYKNISKLIKVIVSIVCFIIIIAVSSRGALLALIPSIILYYIYSEKKITLKNIFISMLFIILFLIIVNNDFIKTVFPYSYNRIFNTLEVGIINDTSATSRLNTQYTILNVMFHNIGLLLFGTGFGNSNMFLSFLRYGYSFNTADTMYIDIFAWCGIIGTIFFVSIFFMLLKRVISIKNNPFQLTLILITICVLLGGISQDTLTEPTIGGIYFVLLGIYEIYNLERNCIKDG